MAEVFKTTDAGESTHHFIQFLMMFQQQALLALGKHPRPPVGAPPANLALALAFIQHLSAIRDRTRGNLTAEESSVMESTYNTLRQHYAEITRTPLS